MLQQLGKFRILRKLGEGAMGEVYLGQDPAIGREVALKTIRGDAALGAEARARFAREARAAGALNHPNLVTVHEFGEDQGLLYLAMEYVPGEDLEALFRERALASPDLLEVLAQVCDGLAYAHGKGVLHRDIKPSNIRVLREGGRLRAKVMDFGVARLEGSELTSTGTVLGTFGYMAPEYIRNGAAEPGSDLFAVGVMLYEGLSGRKPFAGDTTATILYRVVHEDPQPLDPRDLQGVSPKVGALLARALAKHPRNRFADAEVMARALRSARDPAWAGLEGDEATVFLSRPSTPGPRRHRAWALALGLLVAAGLGAWAFRSRVGQVALHSRAAIASGPQLQAPAPSARAPQAPAPRPESEPMAPPVRPGPAAPRHRLEAPAPQAQPPDQPPPPGAAEPSTAEGDTGPTGRLNEAARDLEADPGASLAACDEVLRDHPSNPRAHALRLVALYQLGRDGALRHELQADQNLDLPRGAFLRFEAFRKMLQSERRAPRLPPEDRRALMSLVPRWSGGRPGQGDSGDLEGVAE